MKKLLSLSLLFFTVFAFSQKTVLEQVEELQAQNKINELKIKYLLEKEKKNSAEKRNDIYIDQTLKLTKSMLNELPDMKSIFSKIESNSNTKEIENIILKLMNNFKNDFEKEIQNLPKHKR